MNSWLCFDRRLESGLTRLPRRRASGLLALVGLIAILGGLTAIISVQAAEQYAQGGRFRDAIALKNLAEAGIARARAELGKSPSYTGAERLALGRGEIRIVVVDKGAARRIEVTAAVPALERARRTEKRVAGYRSPLGS